MISRLLFAGLLLSLSLPAHARKRDDSDRERVHRSAGHVILLYVPNRILDALDIVRARVRVGPGIAVSVRATESVDLFAGAYVAAYAGLPGPRNRRLPKLPFGIESKNGVELSKADLTTSLFLFDPDYGSTEFGLGTQVLLVGFDVGVDPGELVDFVVGFATADIKEDDL